MSVRKTESAIVVQKLGTALSIFVSSGEEHVDEM